MKTFIRLVLFSLALAAVAVVPARTQQTFADPALDGLKAEIADLKARIERLESGVDPLAQAPKRTVSNEAVVTVTAVAVPKTVKRLANGLLVECDDNGCRVVTQAVGVRQTFGLADEGPVVVLQERRGPVRRALFGRYR